MTNPVKRLFVCLGVLIGLAGTADAQVTTARLVGTWRGELVVSLPAIATAKQPTKPKTRTLRITLVFKADGTMTTTSVGAKAEAGSFGFDKKGRVQLLDDKRRVVLVWDAKSQGAKKLTGAIHPGPGQKLPPSVNVRATLTLTRK